MAQAAPPLLDTTICCPGLTPPYLLPAQPGSQTPDWAPPPGTTTHYLLSLQPPAATHHHPLEPPQTHCHTPSLLLATTVSGPIPADTQGWGPNWIHKEMAELVATWGNTEVQQQLAQHWNQEQMALLEWLATISEKQLKESWTWT